jgi:hypothetical protein
LLLSGHHAAPRSLTLQAARRGAAQHHLAATEQRGLLG